jgi:hypothetical protein
VLEASAARILEALDQGDLVLDVGAGANPFPRADWVIDLMPYADRGLYGTLSPRDERFDESRWVVRDICDREPWPFADDQFAFAVCSHTLEDVRDPVWVCSELSRVARAGYVEVPSRLEEQSWGVQGPWAGWGHHRWLVDVVDGRLELVFKHHVLHARAGDHFPAGFWQGLTAEQKVHAVWWEGAIEATERVFTTPEELDPYLAGFVAAHTPPAGPLRRLRRRLADR